MRHATHILCAILLTSAGFFASTGAHAAEPAERCENSNIDQFTARSLFASKIKNDPHFIAKFAELLNGYGIGYDQQKNFVEAAACYRWGADLGDRQAEFNLGRLYDNGTGVEQDFDQAKFWWQKSADQGDHSAEAMLGSELVRGENFPKDLDTGERLLKKSAAAGNGSAQFILGAWLIDGQMLPQDIPEGKRLLRKAATQGDAHAKEVLAELAHQGDGTEGAGNADAVRVSSAAPSDKVILRIYREYYRKFAENIGNSTMSSLTRGTASAMGMSTKDDPVMDRAGQVLGLDKLMKAQAAQVQSQIDNEIVTVAQKRKYEGNWVIYLEVRRRGTDTVGTQKMILTPTDGVWQASFPALGTAPALLGFQR